MNEDLKCKLEMACKNGDISLVKALLTQISPTYTALMLAAMYNNFYTAKLLITAGINPADRQGSTLHWFSRNGNEEAVKYLRSIGVPAAVPRYIYKEDEIVTIDGLDESPLCAAISKNHKHLVKYLLTTIERDTTCDICFDTTDKIAFIDCNHNFHVECLGKHNNVMCPYCGEQLKRVKQLTS
jgi:ankyrin repeat protein